MISKLFTDFAVLFHRATAEAGGAILVDGVTSVDFNTALETLLERSDGQFRNTFGSLRAGAPSAVVQTNDLKAALDAIGDFGAIDSDGTHPGVGLYFRRYAQGGTRSVLADALEVMFARGMVVMRSIELSHQATAQATFEVIGESADGETSPVVFDEASALPAGTPGTNVVWTVGKVDIGGTEFDGVQSVSIDFGSTINREARDSSIYPSFVSLQVQQPRITMRGAHLDFTSATTEDGAYHVASTVKIWARKRAEGGKFVADGTAEHILFDLGKCRVEAQAISGEPKEIELTITPWDTAGGAAPITVDTTAAIV